MASSRMPNTRQKSSLTSGTTASIAANDADPFQHDDRRREAQLRPQIDQQPQSAPNPSGMPMTMPRSPFAANPMPMMMATTTRPEHGRTDHLQDGEADQRQQPAAKPLPRLTDRDARPEHRPADDDGEHPAQQDRRQPGGDAAGHAGRRRPEHRRRRRLSSPRSAGASCAGDGQRTDCRMSATIWAATTTIVVRPSVAFGLARM